MCAHLGLLCQHLPLRGCIWESLGEGKAAALPSKECHSHSPQTWSFNRIRTFSSVPSPLEIQIFSRRWRTPLNPASLLGWGQMLWHLRGSEQLCSSRAECRGEAEMGTASCGISAAVPLHPEHGQSHPCVTPLGLHRAEPVAEVPQVPSQTVPEAVASCLQESCCPKGTSGLGGL